MADYYMSSLFDFLGRLRVNNNREWFNAHKNEYLELRQMWLADLQRLINAMAEWQPEMRSMTADRLAYRIYRDTRFSLDKTPYKDYFSALMSPYGRNHHRAAYYLHMGGEDTGLHAGLWCPETDVLKKMRHAIVDNIEEFEEIISDPRFCRDWPNWWGTPLKTAPKGWPKDHPQIELLRLREYGRSHLVGEDFFLDPEWPENAADLFREAKPLVDFLNYSMDE